MNHIYALRASSVVLGWINLPQKLPELKIKALVVKAIKAHSWQKYFSYDHLLKTVARCRPQLTSEETKDAQLLLLNFSQNQDFSTTINLLKDLDHQSTYPVILSGPLLNRQLISLLIHPSAEISQALLKPRRLTTFPAVRSTNMYLALSPC